MSEPRAGTRKVNGKLLRKLREDRGWPVRELADRSGYSERNIERMEAGGPARFETIRDVAQALGDGVSFETLIDGHEEPAAAPERMLALPSDQPVSVGEDGRPIHQGPASGEVQIEPGKAIQNEAIKFQMTFSNETSIDEDTSREAIAAIIKMYVDLKHAVTITAVKKGSIIVELELSEEDLLRLVTAFSEARLDAIHVEAIRLPATTGPLAAGLLQIIQPSDAPAEEMTNPVTPEMTLTRTPAKSLVFSVDEAKPDMESEKRHRLSYLFIGLYVFITCVITIFFTFKIWVQEKPRPGADYPYLILMAVALNGILVTVGCAIMVLQSRKSRK